MLTQPLSELISDYENYDITTFDSELYNYNSTNNLDDLLKRSIYNNYRVKFSLDKSNQYCINSSSLSDMENYCKLTNVRINLLNSKKFEDLLKVMYSPKQIGLITGFCSTYIYDICLRFGVNTSVTLNPDSGALRDIILPDYIYVHNESKNGVENLFENLNIPYAPKYHCWDSTKEFPYLELKDFPSPFNKLLPYHIENFLFIYKDQL